MISHEEMGSFASVTGEAGETEQAICRRLRSLIEEIHPNVVEVARDGDRAVCYGVGPKKMSEAYTYISPKRGYVNLGFFRGTDLPDPGDRLEGSGKRLRHVKIRTEEQAESAEVRALLQAARREREAALGI